MTDKPTPGPWKAHYLPQHRMRITADDASICDIALWQVDYAEQQANTALIVSSCNAVQALASHLNRDPVALAKELEDGGMVELVEALSFYHKQWMQNWDGDPAVPGGTRDWLEPTDEMLKDEGRKARAILSRLRECGG